MKKLISTLVAAGVFIPALAMAQFNSWCPGYGGRFFGFGYGGIFMGILWIVVLVAAGFFFVRVFRNKGVLDSVNSESSLEILKKRYARGELSKEDFDRMKQELA